MNPDKEKIVGLRKQGMSYGSLAKLFCLSRARIHQICSGYKSPGFNREIKLVHDKILLRDGFTCQWGELCKGKKIKIEDLVVHYIDFNNENNSEGNLIALCKFCHAGFHSKNHIDDRFQKNLNINKNNPPAKKVCSYCGKEFSPPLHNNRKTCSDDCFQKVLYRERTKMSAEERIVRHKIQMATYFQKIKGDPLKYRQLKEKQKQYHEKYYQKNKDKINIKNKSYVAKNLEKYRKIWREAARRRYQKRKMEKINEK